jgi:heat shock protein HslJ
MVFINFSSYSDWHGTYTHEGRSLTYNQFLETALMKKLSTFSLVFLITLFLQACSGVTGHGENLEGTTWQLTNIKGNKVLENTFPTLKFEAGQVMGNGSCNSFSGEYKLSGDEMTIGQLISTMMACMAEGVMDQEQAYLLSLGAVTHILIMDEKLELLDKDGQVLLVFIKLDTSLEGKNWQASFLNNGSGTLLSVLSETVVTALFESGTLSGSAGCNGYTALYSLDEDKLRIEPATVTEMYCELPAGMMDQEFQYLILLPLVSSYKVEGNHLTLFDRDGMILIEYYQAD